MFFATTPFIVTLVMSDFSEKSLMLPIQQETHQKCTQGSCQLMRSQTDPIWSTYRVVLEPIIQPATQSLTKYAKCFLRSKSET